MSPSRAARQHVQAIIEGRDIYVRSKHGRFELHWVDPLAIEDEDAAGGDRIVAPLPGTVVAVLAKEGDTLEKGAAVVTLEVMKMEQTLRAPFACKLVKLKCAPATVCRRVSSLRSSSRPNMFKAAA